MSGFFRRWLEALLDGTTDEFKVNWLTDSVVVSLIDSGFAPNFTANEDLADVSTNINADASHTSILASRTLADGDFYSSVVTFTDAIADTSRYVVLYKDSGVGTTSPLMAWYNDSLITPNGGDIRIRWQNSIPFRLY